MLTYPASMSVVMRKPSAVAPIMMSLIALCVVLIAMATGRAIPQRDEGSAAHIWQLLMVGQLPFLGWFASRWLKQDLRCGLVVIGLQICAFAGALLPVWLLGL